MNMDWKTVTAITVGVLIVGYVVKKQAAQAAAAVGSAINPVSNKNIAYQGASALTSAVTGSNLPLGSQIFDWLNPTPKQ